MSSNEPTNEKFTKEDAVDDDEPDEWDKRIIDTGCHKENLTLQLCHADKGDWRQCSKELQAFRDCWSQHNNHQRVHTVDN